MNTGLQYQLMTPHGLESRGFVLPPAVSYDVLAEFAGEGYTARDMAAMEGLDPAEFARIRQECVWSRLVGPAEYDGEQERSLLPVIVAALIVMACLVVNALIGGG